MTILEAMRCGAVVIAAAAGAIDEVLTSGIDGFIVPQGSCVEAMLEPISRLQEDRQLRRNISFDAMKRAEALSWSRNVAPLVAALQPDRWQAEDNEFFSKNIYSGKMRVSTVPDELKGGRGSHRCVWFRSGRLRAFFKNKQGTAAIELALLGLPFLFLIFTLFELALILLLSATLQSALVAASRTIRTGSFQGGSTPTAVTFVNQVCSNMGWMKSACLSQLQVDVRTEANFSSPTEPDPMAAGTFNSAALTFNPGTAGQIVLVRGFYQWPLMTPGFDAGASRTNNGLAVIVETTTFVNEPYP